MIKKAGTHLRNIPDIPVLHQMLSKSVQKPGEKQQVNWRNTEGLLYVLESVCLVKERHVVWQLFTEKNGRRTPVCECRGHDILMVFNQIMAKSTNLTPAQQEDEDERLRRTREARAAAADALAQLAQENEKRGIDTRNTADPAKSAPAKPQEKIPERPPERPLERPPQRVPERLPERPPQSPTEQTQRTVAPRITPTGHSAVNWHAVKPPEDKQSAPPASPTPAAPAKSALTNDSSGIKVVRAKPGEEPPPSEKYLQDTAARKGSSPEPNRRERPPQRDDSGISVKTGDRWPQAQPFKPEPDALIQDDEVPKRVFTPPAPPPSGSGAPRLSTPAMPQPSVPEPVKAISPPLEPKPHTQPTENKSGNAQAAGAQAGNAQAANAQAGNAQVDSAQVDSAQAAGAQTAAPQAAPAAKSSPAPQQDPAVKVPTGGNLRDLEPLKLLYKLALARSTCKIEIDNRGTRALIYLQDGRPVDAMLADLRGDAALLDFLLWNGGKFEVHQGETSTSKTVNTMPDQLLTNNRSVVELITALNERGLTPVSTFKRARERLSKEEFVALASPKAPVAVDQLMLIFEKLDGKRTLSDLTKLQLMPRTLLIRALHHLITTNLATLANPPKPRPEIKGKKIDGAAIQSVMMMLRREETGLFIHPAFLYFLEEEFFRTFRAKGTFSIVIFEMRELAVIDGVEKRRMLPTSAIADAAMRICSRKRHTDVAAHYEAFDFAILLPSTGSSGTRIFINRVIKSLRESPLRGMEGKQLSLAFGTATIPEDCKDLNQLLGAAEMSMQTAREQGQTLLQFKDIEA